MIIKLSKFMSVDGQVETMQTPFELSSIAFNNMEYKILKSSPINLTILHTGEQKVEILGDTKVTLLISCDRCLKGVELDLDIIIDEEFNFNSEKEDEINQIKEANYLNEYNLDIDLLVYEAIILDFPMKVLCNDDCKGLCSTCGTNLNVGSCECESTSLDPRMAAIQDVFNESKEV